MVRFLKVGGYYLFFFCILTQFSLIVFLYSLIPTEDEEEEGIYADCDVPTPTVVPAPPVPNTPRPQFGMYFLLLIITKNCFIFEFLEKCMIQEVNISFLTNNFTSY